MNTPDAPLSAAAPASKLTANDVGSCTSKGAVASHIVSPNVAGSRGKLPIKKVAKVAVGTHATCIGHRDQLPAHRLIIFIEDRVE